MNNFLYCSNCNNQVAAGTAVCPYCNQQLSAPPQSYYPVQPVYAPAPQPYYCTPAPKATNGMAIASLVTAFVLAPLGIIFGIIGLNQIKKNGEEGKGLAIAGIVIGAVITLGYVLLIIYYIAIFAWLFSALGGSYGSGSLFDYYNYY